MGVTRPWGLWVGIGVVALTTAAGAWGWGRIRSEGGLGREEAVREAREALRVGRFARAEAVLERFASEAGGVETPARSLYEKVLDLEGRGAEYRAMLVEDARSRDDPTSAVVDLWRLDTGPYPIERVREGLERLAESLEKSAGWDDRLWLARGNLEVRAGRYEEAARLLDRCEKQRPDDLAVLRAQFQLAMARDELEGALTRLAGLSEESFDAAGWLEVRAWFAAWRGDARVERESLESLLALDPGRAQAVERLAEIAESRDEAARWRDRKAAIDRAHEPYRQAINAAEGARDLGASGRLAETLGRMDDARAWHRLALKRNPDDGEAREALARLDAGRAARPGAVVSLATLRAEARGGTLRLRSLATARGNDAGAAPSFKDEAARAGLSFVYQSGKTLVHQLPETMGGGVGLLDYDGDGFLDIYVVQGGSFPPDAEKPSAGDRLFRNNGDGAFKDMTERAGISKIAGGYGHGVAVGDYDNDGRPDIFLTRWRSYALLHNKGDGTFEDVTTAAGLGGGRDWPTSAAFADFDGDGDLDLYVCHYLAWDAENPHLCRNPETSAYTYCAPLVFSALGDHLFRNDDGRFVDVSKESGITGADSEGRGLGVVAADLDEDGRVDLFVANDASAKFLFLNQGGMKFEEMGHASGVAGNAEGGYQGSMGLACGDLDGDGRPDLAVTNLYGESTAFYRNLGGGQFADRTAAVGLAVPSRYLLGFGAGFFDFNNDGRLDFASVNGHVNDFRPTYPYAMPCQLMAGAAGGRLWDVSGRAGSDWTRPRVGRALALGDLDNDGRIDALVVSLDSPMAYLHNNTEAGHFLTLRLQGSSSNRDAVGARVAVRAGGREQTAWRFGGGGYQSSSDPRIHFGLGAASAADEVEVRWPGGRISRFPGLPGDSGYLLREDREKAEALKGFQRTR